MRKLLFYGMGLTLSMAVATATFADGKDGKKECKSKKECTKSCKGNKGCCKSHKAM
jgi:hypothetical protein